MTLPKETIDKIKADAETHADSFYLLRPTQGDELEEWETIRDIHTKGATEWAVRAQPVIDALEELVNLKCIKDQFGKMDEYLNNQPLAWEAAINALAKYKEVSNEG